MKGSKVVQELLIRGWHLEHIKGMEYFILPSKNKVSRPYKWRKIVYGPLKVFVPYYIFEKFTSGF